jgi:lysyl-tRNA synthetase, class II
VDNELVRQREENLEALIRLGVDPAPYRFEVTHHADQARDAFEALSASGQAISLAGRLMTIRGHGKTTFADLQDASGRIQVYFKQDAMGESAYQVVKLLDLGDCIGVKGTLFRTKMGEITVQVTELTFLAKCRLPLPEKWHGLRDPEIRFRQRYVDLLVNEEARRLVGMRAAVIRSLRAGLDAEGYLEVDTPVLQPIYGGAFARPFVTHHEALGVPLYLRISNELYLKRLIVGGLERVYEIARDFRNEGIDRTHNPEFSMLEFYQAYADYNDMMPLTERLVADAMRAAGGRTQASYRGDTLDFTPPWPRKGYFEALREKTGIDFREVDEAGVRRAAGELGVDLGGQVGLGYAIDAIFSERVVPDLVQPTFIVDFPIELSPLARKHRLRPGVVERFEVFAGRMELANAFSEQNDPEAQAAAFQRQQELREKGNLEAQPTDEDYVRALRIGMPPTGGVGIGLDRLVMIAGDAANIREVILFPQLRPEGGREDGEEPLESEEEPA